MLTDEAKTLRNEYLRKWRKNNMDKVRGYNKKYREENPQVIKEAKDRYWNKKALEMASCGDKYGDN